MPMTTTKREQNKINSKRRILHASRRLFASQGYDNTMIEDIAKKADVSKATLYNYFPNKESLLIGTEKELIDKLRTMVDTNSEGLENSELMLRFALEELVIASAEYWNLARRITYLNSNENSTLYNGRKDLDELFRELIVSAQQEGIFKKDADPEEVGDIVIGIYLISQFQWDHIDKYTPEQIHQKLNAYFDIVMASYYI